MSIFKDVDKLGGVVFILWLHRVSAGKSYRLYSMADFGAGFRTRLSQGG